MMAMTFWTKSEGMAETQEENRMQTMVSGARRG
jgi:hypothetical protein